MLVCIATTLTFVLQLLIGVPLWRRRSQTQSVAVSASKPLFIRFAVFSIFDVIGAVYVALFHVHISPTHLLHSTSLLFALGHFDVASHTLLGSGG
jgi:uncharacterized membrane protein (DUF2068 family)